MHTDRSAQDKLVASVEDRDSDKQDSGSLILRVLRNPLFLVVSTWVIMAFLLAFEISGK